MGRFGCLFDHLTGFKILRVGLEGNWARCVWAGWTRWIIIWIGFSGIIIIRIRLVLVT